MTGSEPFVQHRVRVRGDDTDVWTAAACTGLIGQRIVLHADPGDWTTTVATSHIMGVETAADGGIIMTLHTYGNGTEGEIRATLCDTLNVPPARFEHEVPLVGIGFQVDKADTTLSDHDNDAPRVRRLLEVRMREYGRALLPPGVPAQRQPEPGGMIVDAFQRPVRRKPTPEEAEAIMTLVRGGWLKLELDLS